MNKLSSIIAAAIISTSNIRQRMTSRSHVLPMVSHIALLSRAKDDYESMTVKQLRKLLTEKKVKGRSKLVRKADILRALRSL